MNRNEEILIILQEECAEVIQAVSKVRRFGLEQNEQDLKKELADLRCMLDLVEAYKVVTYEPQELGNMIIAKQKKLEVYSKIFVSNS
jgi:hypothetical protein